jgi:RND family efflux transporter MFP subunit
MQEHIARALTFLRGGAQFIFKGIRELAIIAWAHKIASAAVIVAVIGVLVGLSFIFKEPAEEALNANREVRLLSVSDLSAPEPVSLIGEIRSVSEANVAPDSSGSVSRVYRTLGEYVGAGSVIAELKNDSQRAGVAQAEAALEKARSGAAISGISVNTAENSLSAALESSRNTVASAYATIDDAVHKKADAAFSNANGANPIFFVSTSNSQAKLSAENSRLTVQPILEREAAASSASPATADALLDELETLSAEAEKVRLFLTNVVVALNGAIATGSVTDSAIAGYRADASAALSAVNGLKSTLTSAAENLKAKRAAVLIAEQNLSGSTGENADIKAAEANLAAARANLEKTVIRAPISGTINKLDLDVGSFVNASVPVVYITNARGLEAVAYVSERDLPDIVQGAQVTVSGSIQGKVSRIASALDPVTKKAEIRIAIPQDAALVSGSSASISIARTVKTVATDELSIPLSALKLTPEGSVVFTVEAGKAVSHPVILGTLRGSKVDIESGITSDMRIIEDARGLKEGQEVTVQNP